MLTSLELMVSELWVPVKTKSYVTLRDNCVNIVMSSFTWLLTYKSFNTCHLSTLSPISKMLLEGLSLILFQLTSKVQFEVTRFAEMGGEASKAVHVSCVNF